MAKVELAEMTRPYAALPPVTKLGSMQEVIDFAQKTEPGMQVRYVASPAPSSPLIVTLSSCMATRS